MQFGSNKSGSGRGQFERLLKPHMPRLFRLACRLADSRADADDLFQNTLVRVYQRLDELRTLTDPASWLCRVMYNLFIDDRRRYARERLRVVEEGRLPGRGIDGLAAAGADLADVLRGERLALLQRALAQLGEAQRVVVLLHDAEGYKIREIEAITGDPAGTVKSRLHRARQRLRELLPDLLPDDGTFS